MSLTYKDIWGVDPGSKHPRVDEFDPSPTTVRVDTSSRIAELEKRLGEVADRAQRLEFLVAAAQDAFNAYYEGDARELGAAMARMSQVLSTVRG